MRPLAMCLVLSLPLAVSAPAQQPEAKPIFTREEVMIPMRDGVHLQTVILTPVEQDGPLPILP
jgi:predicted acyl esterase